MLTVSVESLHVDLGAMHRYLCAVRRASPTMGRDTVHSPTLLLLNTHIQTIYILTHTHTHQIFWSSAALTVLAMYKLINKQMCFFFKENNALCLNQQDEYEMFVL